jgi:outer membrane protein assembly factor BamB
MKHTLFLFASLTPYFVACGDDAGTFPADSGPSDAMIALTDASTGLDAANQLPTDEDAGNGDAALTADAASGDAAIAAEGTELWAHAIGIYASPPAVGDDGKIYVGGLSNLTAINPDGEGHYLFSAPSGWPGTAPAQRVFSAPAVTDDGTVFVGSNTDRFFAIEPDGDEKWFKDHGAVHHGPAIGADGTIYIGTHTGFVRALDPETGDEKWSYRTGNAANSVVVLSDGSLAVGTASGVVFVSTAGKSLGLVGNQPIPEPIAVGDDDTVYAVDDDGKLFAIGADRVQAWELQLDVAVPAAPVVGADGTIYAGNSAVDATGKLKWKASGGGWFAARKDGSSLLAVGTDLLILSSDGDVLTTVALEFVTSGAPTIGSDGTIYVDNGNKAQLLALSGSQPLPSKGWPTVGGNAASDNRAR